MSDDTQKHGTWIIVRGGEPLGEVSIDPPVTLEGARIAFHSYLRGDPDVTLEPKA